MRMRVPLVSFLPLYPLSPARHLIFRLDTEVLSLGSLPRVEGKEQAFSMTG